MNQWGPNTSLHHCSGFFSFLSTLFLFPPLYLFSVPSSQPPSTNPSLPPSFPSLLQCCLLERTKKKKREKLPTTSSCKWSSPLLYTHTHLYTQTDAPGDAYGSSLLHLHARAHSSVSLKIRDYPRYAVHKDITYMLVFLVLLVFKSGRIKMFAFRGIIFLASLLLWEKLWKMSIMGWAWGDIFKLLLSLKSEIK